MTSTSDRGFGRNPYRMCWSLWLSYQRDLQIGWPVFRLVKSATVDVFAAMKKHAVLDIDEVIVDICLPFGKTKQRKGFPSYILRDVDIPRVETMAWKGVCDMCKSLMQRGHLIGFICNIVQVVCTFCNRVLSPPDV